MSQNKHAPRSLRLGHGMEHAGISPAALEVERTRAFKKAFIATISASGGFEAQGHELVGSQAAGLDAFLDQFDETGSPPEEAIGTFLDGVLGSLPSEVGKLATIEKTKDCCIRVPEGWKVCTDFLVSADGVRWTVEDAVARYEADQQVQLDPAVRAELANLGVFVELCWAVDLSG